jgi:hypothetical protein
MAPTIDPAARRELCQALSGATTRRSGQSNAVHVSHLSAALDSAVTRNGSTHGELALTIARFSSTRTASQAQH